MLSLHIPSNLSIRFFNDDTTIQEWKQYPNGHCQHIPDTSFESLMHDQRGLDTPTGHQNRVLKEGGKLIALLTIELLERGRPIEGLVCELGHGMMPGSQMHGLKAFGTPAGCHGLRELDMPLGRRKNDPENLGWRKHWLHEHGTLSQRQTDGLIGHGTPG